MRRFWHPVCLSAELTDTPHFLKILSEELVAFRDKSGQLGLLHGRIDVWIPMILEDPEVPVDPDVDAGRLDQLWFVRVELDPAGLDLGFDVTIREEHPGNLPVPVRCLGEHSPARLTAQRCRSARV